MVPLRHLSIGYRDMTKRLTLAFMANSVVRTLLTAFALHIPPATANSSSIRTVVCDIRDLDDLVSDPLSHAGKMFCGEVFIADFGDSVLIFRDLNDLPPSMDLNFLAYDDRVIQELSESPQMYYIEALIDPHPLRECFEAPPENACFPYRRPITFYVYSATRIR